MTILRIDQEIRENIGLCTREQLLQIRHDLNDWKWNDLLGQKPKGFDDLPYSNTKWLHKLVKRKNKYDIVHPIIMYISGMFSEKELLHYHNVVCNGMLEDEFDKFWCEHELRKYCSENNIKFV